VGFACKREIYFLAKIGLFIETNRFFAWLISAFNAIPLRRGAGAIGGYEKAERLLQEGKGICIFPEGTRSKTGKLLSFKKGAVSLACKMKVPIYPVYLKNVEKSPLDWILRRKRLVVKIGFPLFPEDDSKDYIERLNNELRERILKLGEELEKGYNFQ
jgi:1-acyl-sn-glycerol-3-phosphate acyltransferase